MRTFLIISQAIYIFTLIPWIAVAMMSPMAFDGGFSAFNISFVALLLAYSIAVITCSIIAWLLHRTRARAGTYVNLIPCLWIVGCIVLFSLPNL